MTETTYRVLVADDDENILELVELYLRKEGYRVLKARDGAEALRQVERERPHLVVLDVMMPEMDGWQVCREIRHTYRLPVIMLTAKGEDYDKILGLELGADDYVTKPFNPRELLARVKAVLRRAWEKEERPRALNYGDLALDMDRFQVQRQGRPLALTRKETELLWLLAARPGRVFSRETLLEQVWGYTYHGDARTVDTHIKRLRQKLGESDAWEIQTVWGVGYKFSVHHA